MPARNASLRGGRANTSVIFNYYQGNANTANCEYSIRGIRIVAEMFKSAGRIRINGLPKDLSP